MKNNVIIKGFRPLAGFWFLNNGLTVHHSAIARG